MELSKKELLLLRGVLSMRRCYKGMSIPHGAVVWEDWMQETLDKVEKEIEEKYSGTKPWSPYGSHS